jgi:hypothetical protein
MVSNSYFKRGKKRLRCPLSVERDIRNRESEFGFGSNKGILTEHQYIGKGLFYPRLQLQLSVGANRLGREYPPIGMH